MPPSGADVDKDVGLVRRYLRERDALLAAVDADPAAAADDWHKRYGAIQINHMVTVSEKLARENPDIVREIYRLLTESMRGTLQVNVLPHDRLRTASFAGPVAPRAATSGA